LKILILGKLSWIGIILLWFLLLIFHLTFVFYEYFTKDMGSFLSVIGLIADKVFAKAAIDALPFLIMFVSLSISHHYQYLQNTLINAKSPEIIAKVRQSFVDSHKLIIKLDQSLIFVIILQIKFIY